MAEDFEHEASIPSSADSQSNCNCYQWLQASLKSYRGQMELGVKGGISRERVQLESRLPVQTSHPQIRRERTKNIK